MSAMTNESSYYFSNTSSPVAVYSPAESCRVKQSFIRSMTMSISDHQKLISTSSQEKRQR